MKRAHDVIVMRGVLRAHENLIRFLDTQHLVETVRRVRRHRVILPVAREQFIIIRHPRRTQIADRDEFVAVTIGRDQGLHKTDGATAGADERVTLFAHVQGIGVKDR